MYNIMKDVRTDSFRSIGCFHMDMMPCGALMGLGLMSNKVNEPQVFVMHKILTSKVKHFLSLLIASEGAPTHNHHDLK
jgi:hypothetical protein